MMAIKNVQDQLQFQADLDALTNWGTLWGMEFNARKCNIMSVTNIESPLTKLYEINNTVLSHVDAATYLGVLIHKTLKFNDHIADVANKCNRKLGFIKRNLRGCPQRLKQTAYFSLVRSSAEYAGAIWDPIDTVCLQNQLQRVQHRAVRWVCGYSPRDRVSVSELMDLLKWPPLARRRKEQRITLMYKIVHGEVAITPEDFSIAPARSRESHKHRHTLLEHNQRTDTRKFSFVNATIRDWNNLPATVAEADSTPIFKGRLAAALLD